MAVTKVAFTATPVGADNGRAALTLADPSGNTSYDCDVPHWVLDDGGAIVGLSSDGHTVTACPIKVGVAHATCYVVEDGVLKTGTATITVTLVGKVLTATWASGTMTVH
jgi:hypothetical protein